VEAEAMSEVDVVVWLTCGYAAFLLLAAYGLDLMAKRTSRHTADWRSGSFTYHEDHDAWVCPEDQWLWPQSFDPDNRVMRYRANPTVCNNCPVKDTCTTSDSGREISRNVDPWPHSEAGRFHRGMACSVAILAILLPLFTMIGNSALESGVLAAAAVFVGLASWPLWSHLRHTPAGFPEHVPVERAAGPVPVETQPASPEPTDRFTTRWSGLEAPTSGAASRSGWRRINRP
jgi:hypothetical protein